MPWSEQEIAERFRDGMVLDPGPDCPPSEALWDAVAGVLPQPQRERVIAHMADCRHCAFVWQAAREMQPAAVPAAKPESRTPWWQSLLRPPVLAPLAGAAAALLVAVLWMGSTGLPEVPGPEPSGVMRGMPDSDRTLTTGEAILAPGQVLSWTPVAGATAYKLVLFSDEGSRVEILPSETDQYRLDPGLAQSFQSGERVYWYVEAIDGESPGTRSATASFELRVQSEGG